jgi:hypothetical protein
MNEECISTGRSLWRAQDGNKAIGKNTPFLPVKDHREAEEWNEKQWGIYWTINELNGGRAEENLVRIISWAVDFDEGTKDEQIASIKRFGLIPSLVVESARGFHVYYDSIDATKENYNKILEGLCTQLGADKQAKGVNRILRVPFYFHWKDPTKPFPVALKAMNSVKYSEAEMLKFLKRNEVEKKPATKFTNKLNKFKGGPDDFFAKVDRLNCAYALQVLSGTDAVNHEQYSFRQLGSKHAVLVNGKSANVWIDSAGRIGSSDKGGPTIYQWLKWFGHDHEKIKKYLEDYFPEMRS